MKSISFNFTHPFKGRGKVIKQGQPNSCIKQFLLDSKESNLVEIPLEGYQNGKYSIVLDWETDNRFFVHQQEFEICGQPTLIPATL